MSIRDEVREFLVTRRANITPAQAGVETSVGERRVPGLRREEVAALAGVSLEYYTRLERGAIGGASEGVLDAIAGALQLGDAERTHLFDLARRSAGTRRAAPSAAPAAVSPSVQVVLDSMTVPAIVYSPHQDIVAANLAGRAFYAEAFEADRPNLALYIFLDSRARRFYGDWELACSLNAAMLRYEAGRNPLDTALTGVIGELSTRSPQFRDHWADHDVHEHRSGLKTFRHPVVGELELSYDVFDIPGAAGLSMTTYSAAAGSDSADRLRLLAAWAATQDEAGPGNRTA